MHDLTLADVSQQFEAFRKLAQRLGLGHSQGLRLIYTHACTIEVAQTVIAVEKYVIEDLKCESKS